MTQFSDFVQVGEVNWPPAGSIGARTSMSRWYSVVPATGALNNVAANQVVSNGGWTITSALTQVTIGGVSYYDLGLARCLTFSGASVSTAAVQIQIQGFSAIVSTTNGAMVPNMPLTQAITGPAATATVTTTKAFRYIKATSGITSTGNTVSGISVGLSDTIGLPFAVQQYGQMLVNDNGTWVTTSVRQTLAVTSTATAITGDTRGTYALASASDGVKQLNILIHLANPNSKAITFGVDDA